ncbi:hypothetical protein CspeluHIS016_0405290 [Cutaneotrichosporon spelunceum]|uniref:MFS general substrate transporter n=1 Tax=Cutaneotrichosporon spelunceum TaxID=1672016 RepID=A0AAD3YC36_9TREE|nr:hypothetical protein CspeluHIS016_0405290 [Cutaneotrichosporon spelunceum]
MVALEISPRIRMFIAAIFVGLASGSNYGYSGYAPQLASKLGLSSTQINLVGLGGNLGVYLSGPVWGRIIDGYGPRVPLACAAALNFVGYHGTRAFYYSVLPIGDEDGPTSLGVTALAMALFLTGLAGSAGLAGAMNTVARSFPDRTRASATGSVLAGFGLSAFVFSALGHALFRDEAGGLLLILAWGTMLPNLVGTFVIRPYPPREDSSDDDYTDDEDLVHQAAQLEPGQELPGRSRERSADVEMADEASPSDPLLPRTPSRTGSSADLQTPSRTPRTRTPRSRKRRSSTASLPATEIHLGPPALFRETDFLLLFSILAILCGVGLEWINNVGAVTLALARKGWDYDKRKVGAMQASQVATISVCNCAGRILGGAFSDLIKHRFGVRRIWFLPLVALMFIGAEVAVLATSDVERLWMVSAALGIAYGALFNVLPMLVLEWFGMSHFGQNWGFTSMAPAVGGNIFLTLFGKVYDAHSVSRIGRPAAPKLVPSPVTRNIGIHQFSRVDERSGDSANALAGAADAHECLVGRDCYATAIRVSAVACVLALILSVIAGIRRERASAARRGRLA